MKLRASVKALETNIQGVISTTEAKKVQVDNSEILKAQKAEFEAYLTNKTNELGPNPKFTFIPDMLAKMLKGTVLSENMVNAIRKCKERDAEYLNRKSDPGSPAEVEDKDLRVMTLKMKQFWINKNNLGSRVITGKIMKESAKAYYMVGHADMVEGTWCMRCGKELTEPASMVIGYGAICCAKIGVDYPSDILTAPKKERQALRKQLLKVLHDQTFEAWVPKSQIQEDLTHSVKNK